MSRKNAWLHHFLPLLASGSYLAWRPIGQQRLSPHALDSNGGLLGAARERYAGIRQTQRSVLHAQATTNKEKLHLNAFPGAVVGCNATFQMLGLGDQMRLLTGPSWF
ncbi:hypothetical protein TASIC1_0008020000 [Trichoderma asperellum]|uniref:Secreted protein n=1 Tax=Trichoderma asperellum TaxID=101201 RepID=A0A6V8QY19_TRIAP|nr:hypothetical protein TASIC1_0008020000 [Trichoderma asperellum]